MSSKASNLTKGSAHVKRTSIISHVLRHKTKDIVVHPSMLTYFNNEQLELVIDRPKHHKYDFLLAPLGLTEIVQLQEDLLLLVSKRRKVLDESTGEVKRLNVPVVYQEMTLKFASRGERDYWMKAIIAECGQVYLKGLIDTSLYFAGKFVEAAHNEIWSHILLGDETLRRAYIAPVKSDQWELVHIVLIAVIEWLQALLGVTYLVPVHKKVFVELFSLMLQDPAVRALFMLVRPKEGFLQAFKTDRATGDYAPDKNNDKDPAVSEVRSRVTATKSFIREIKFRMQSSTWKQYRSFLAIIDHPAMPSADESSATGEGDLRSSGWGLAALLSPQKHSSHITPVEWAWYQSRTRPPISVFTWEMMKNAVSDTPYLSYHFITMKIKDTIDVRKVLLLLERVPLLQRNLTFEVDRVAKPHFCALVEYFKFREVWKVFYVNHMNSTPFFEAVHNLIWSRIAISNDPILRSIFLHTTVTSTPEVASFADVLNIEMVANINDIQYLRRLAIHVGPDNQVTNSHYRSTVFFRKLAMDRLMLWVKRIFGVTNTDLDPAHASVFVNLLVAAAMSAVVRAVFWLILPAKDAFQEGADTTLGGIPVVVDQFIDSLLNLAKPVSRLERFLTFLIVAEHPLKGAVHIASPQRTVSPPNIAVGVDSYAVTMTWANEIVWMDKYPQQTWSLSWGELTLLRTDTPYFSLQVLLRRLHQETEASKSLDWLELLTSMPKDIVRETFLADVNMCAVNGIHQFGAHLKHTAAHFLTFVDSRRVVELWRIFETTLLNSNPAFVEEAQNHLLFVLNHQRESPGNNETNRSGFFEMMLLLDKATTADDASFKDVTFRTLIPMSVVGDKMWQKLQSLFRPDGENTVSVAPIAAIGALKSEHLTAFKKFMDHIAEWSAAFFGSDAPGGNSGGGFADLLSACLDNAVLRAVCMIVKPKVRDATDALDTATTSQRLTNMLASLNQQKSDGHLLYLLLQLGYKGIKEEEDGSLTITELSWAVESEWLRNIESSFTVVLDSADFALLADPAYLLFRYVSRNFQNIDTYGLVNRIQKKLPDAFNRDFYAHDNYLPCRHNQRVREGEAVTGPHFKHLLNYNLYNEMWKVIMAPLNDPSMDSKFAQAVVYATWLLVKSNTNLDLSTMLLPLEADLKWEKLTYLMAVQRCAIISIKRCGKFRLRSLYPTLMIADNLTVAPFCISAHSLLINRIIKWVNLLLGGQKHSMEETDAELFMTLFTAAAADVVMRAFLVTVEPEPSVVADFMKNNRYAQDAPLTVGEPPAAALCAASIMCVKLLSQTFRREGWEQFRSFLTVLNHPLLNAGKGNRNEPLWKDESKWIQERNKMTPAIVSWQELEYVMTETPYIFLLMVTKALPTVGQQKAAMLAMPPKYLLDQFKANKSRLSGVVVCAPHFIVMCLHEATRECALEVFQERGLISDSFFEALLREAVLDSSCPHLLPAFRLLQRFLYEDNKCVDWNIGMLRCIPNISSILIKFLWDISKRENFRRDEKIIGNLVLLVFQLESCSSNRTFTQATVPASKLMRGDTDIKKKVC